MIVLDNFVSEQHILKAFTDIKLWKELEGSNFNSWDGKSEIKHGELGDLIWKIKNSFWADKGLKKGFERFEYWVNVQHKKDHLDWHIDKNESIMEETDQVVCPQIGAVWYGYPHKIKGGYLEIQHEDSEVERIQPLYNRIIVFDVSKFHRVSPIASGIRFGLQLNLW